MLLSRDPRAQSLLRDIARDPVAHEIISRVDASLYSVKGCRQDRPSPVPQAGLGSWWYRGWSVLPATFDAIRRGINPGNDFVCHRITCYVSQQRLSAGVTRQQHNADKRFGLMEAGFNGINVALGGSALPRWSQKSTCYNRMRMGECTEKDIHTGAK